jgi:hypothetical protein
VRPRSATALRIQDSADKILQTRFCRERAPLNSQTHKAVNFCPAAIARPTRPGRARGDKWAERSPGPETVCRSARASPPRPSTRPRILDGLGHQRVMLGPDGQPAADLLEDLGGIPLPRARTAPGAPCGTLQGRRATGTPRTGSRSVPRRDDAAADPRGHAATGAHPRASRRVCHRPGTGESHDANQQVRGRAEPKHSKAAATSPRPHVSA